MNRDKGNGIEETDRAERKLQQGYTIAVSEWAYLHVSIDLSLLSIYVTF